MKALNLSNTSSTYLSTRRDMMAAVGKLPREIRDTLNAANFPFAPQRLRAPSWRLGGVARAAGDARGAKAG